ncbi:MAG TPA: deoxyribodipyrimidine photolyase [Polyangiaceae bacterium LLY-WYZ-14_1]|nr:deoxyribodipyrimidine photolyase [Polyangiaceae bacterium LLY-WYZ-14_1]
MAVPSLRVRALNDAPVRGDAAFVLYWMVAFRRPTHNFALDRAVERARELGQPLVVLEALRLGYPYASERLHRFILQGMADNAAFFAGQPVTHHAYVERREDDGKGLLRKLASRASIVVTDDYPSFFLPRMLRAAAERIPCRLEAVDSNGLYPMRAAERTFPMAHSFRRHLQKTLRPHLDDFPKQRPFAGLDLPRLPNMPRAITERWPGEDAASLGKLAEDVSELPLDHAVPPTEETGGREAGRERLKGFVASRLSGYADGRNHPDEDAASGLSPWLHFGHVSPHEVFEALADRDGWSRDDLADKAHGKREGWWGMSPEAEAFLDELVTWRELGFNLAHREEDTKTVSSLPDWAQKTLAEHADDPREHIYEGDQFDRAETHDEVWNAAQRQLRTEGRIHNYLRMLWGKKILHWSRSPEEALEIMFELNDRYALDGRDPNSVSGITWCLGRFDRAWGPERPIFGKVRYMTSDSTRRKLRLGEYLARWGREAA